jgi:hypothetical protein
MLKRRQRGRGAWGGCHRFGSVSKTETSVQLLLHNRYSEEDTFEGGWYSYCNVSSWRTCRVQKDHDHVKGCDPALLEVTPRLILERRGSRMSFNGV